jgi:hypothetical protein
MIEMRKTGSLLMNRNKKKIQIISLDIPNGYLEYLENLLFKNSIFRENNAIYIKGKEEPIDYNIESIEYAKFFMEYRDVLSIGKSTNPIKIFKTFKVIFKNDSVTITDQKEFDKYFISEDYHNYIWTLK